MSFLKIAAQLAFDGSRFQDGMRRATSQAHEFGKEISSSLKGELASIFGAGAMIAFTKHAIEATAAIKDQAEQSRGTTDEVQRLTIAAENAGLAWEDVSAAERRFNINRREAAESNQELRDTFEKYGMTLEDLNNPQLRFVDFLQRANVAMKDFSALDKQRAGAELNDMLGKLGPKLQGFFAEVEKAKDKPIVPEDAINGVDEADKKLKALTRTASAFLAVWASRYLTKEGILAHIFGGGVGATWNQTIDRMTRDGPGAMQGPDLDGSGRSGEDDRLYKDKLADAAQKKKDDELKKAYQDQGEAALKYAFNNANAAGKRKLLEGQMTDKMGTINENPLDSIAGQKARIDLFGLLGQMDSLKGGSLPVSNLTRMGQWSGRAMQNTPDSEIVKEVKRLLIPAQTSANQLEQINLKVKQGKTLISTV